MWTCSVYYDLQMLKLEKLDILTEFLWHEAATAGSREDFQPDQTWVQGRDLETHIYLK